MKKLVVSILFILVGVFVTDRVGGLVMQWVNLHTHDVTGPKIKHLVYDVGEDVIMMGTSRCNSHYVPSIISDSIGMSVYNGGIDASNNIFSHYIILNHILACHAPKVICLEVQNSDCFRQTGTFNSISFFAPYFGRNAQADSVFLLAGSYWKYKLSHLYRYNSKAVSNIAGLLINRHEGGDNGYIPNPKPVRSPQVLSHANTRHDVDSTKINFVNRFVNLCRQHHVKLVFVVSPMYRQVDADHYDVLKALAKSYDIPFLDYHTTGLFQDHPEYFRDVTHLWDQGARAYSSIFASDLKQVLLQLPAESH